MNVFQRMLLFFPSLLSLGLFSACDTQKPEPLEIEREFITTKEGGVGDGPFLYPRQLANGMWAQTFVVPATMFVGHGESEVVDPFSTAPEMVTPRNFEQKKVKDVFENAGIQFPAGSHARYFPRTSSLTLILPYDQLELAWAYMESIGGSYERQIMIRVELYELDESHYEQILESSLNEPDHRPERDALLAAVKRGQAQLVSSPMVMARSGNRSKVEEGFARLDEQGKSIPATMLEVDPVLGADSWTIDLNLYLSYKGSDQGDSPQEINANLVTIADQYRILGGWKHEQGQRHLAFLYTSVRNLVE